jgi:uroporphyrinogen decarboxylase
MSHSSASHPTPNFERMRKVLLRRGEPDRVPFVELFADREIMGAVIGEPVPIIERHDCQMRELSLKRTIRFWYETGYDYVTVQAMLDLPMKRVQARDTAALRRDQRSWVDESSGVINSWADFEAYPWPRSEEVDYYNLEFVARNLPDGMEMIFLGPGGQLENIMWLMGYVPFSLLLRDDPELVMAVARKVGELLVTVFSTAAEMPGVGALWLGDDMGFKTATMVSPEIMRQYVFPWQRKLGEIAHAHELPFLLHSCGNLSQIMDDLIIDVAIDAKHSFEDVIMPVAEAKRLYGDRIALLGGIDVDFLCRFSVDEVRAYTRRVIDACAPGGGWALGTGNSVANYVPIENYLAMLDEGKRYGVY